MVTNVLEYLEDSAKLNGDKIAFSDGKKGLTFAELLFTSRKIGSGLCNECRLKPIIVFMEKSPEMIAAFLGVLYSGNYYVPVSKEMNLERIQKIVDKLNPHVIIFSENTKKEALSLKSEAKIFAYADLSESCVNQGQLISIRNNSVDADPMYIVFTSGSTGVPKGVIATHASVINYIEGLVDILGINDQSVFASQAPFYMDACLRDILPTIKCGASTFLIPKQLFMFPLKLVEFINEHKINTLCWVSSALVIVSSTGTLDICAPQYVHTIAFVGEVFPAKQYLLWKKARHNAQFTNLYGPTETTGITCYYTIEGEICENEPIPIGKAIPNTNVFLYDEENNSHITEEGRLATIFIRGSGITKGYYNDRELTNKVFVQNPLQDNYNEIVYNTGDLGKYNSEGELLYVARKDFQIKRRGYRLELTEIEAAVNNIEAVGNSCAVYNKDDDNIVLFYSSQNEDVASVQRHIRKRLPSYA